MPNGMKLFTYLQCDRVSYQTSLEVKITFCLAPLPRAGPNIVIPIGRYLLLIMLLFTLYGLIKHT